MAIPWGTLGSAIGMGLGELAEKAAGVLDAPRRLAWQALGLPESGAEAVSQLTGLESDSPLAKALGIGAEMIFDPVNLATGGLGGLLGKAGGKALKAIRGASEAGVVWPRYRALKKLREGFGIVKDVHMVDDPLEAASIVGAGRKGYLPRRMIVEGSKGNPIVGMATGGLGRSNRQAMTELAEMAQREPALGMYSRDIGAGAIVRDAPASVLRHESLHGLVHQAGQRGMVNELPLIMRLPARLSESERPFLQGLGFVLDELSSHALQNRGFWNQLRGGLHFLARPNPAYYHYFHEVSPLAARLYWHTPSIARGAGAVGLSGLAYGVGNLLDQEE